MHFYTCTTLTNTVNRIYGKYRDKIFMRYCIVVVLQQTLQGVRFSLNSLHKKSEILIYHGDFIDDTY